jgi:hypothetical protein
MKRIVLSLIFIAGMTNICFCPGSPENPAPYNNRTSRGRVNPKVRIEREQNSAMQGGK